ncbi:FAD/NAD(P)-binding domain-containing protein [Phlegmacium glaucopus]|nr:FAD/NAD(P)-binding domain-containing protein [Phlegmacium glaucopus]
MSSECAPHVAIVGAGLAGIAAAIQLKKKLNFHNFTIYEKEDGVGGTWRLNTYPGCGSDVPVHWYSLSTDLNPRWERYYASQPELRAYWENLWHKYDLVKHTRLNTAVRNAQWSNETQRYTVSLENVATKETSQVGADVMIYAIGGFQGPLYPKDIPGREQFRGEIFHSAEWRHDVILKNKRVGVIGNGCSAAQFIPLISEDFSVKVVNFCRTPQWYVPRRDFRYPAWAQWMFAHIPFLMRWYRNWIMARADLGFLIFRKDNKLLLSIVRKEMSAYIKSKAPKEEMKNLIPKYAPGCKRIIVDPQYLDSLNRPNVRLQWDAIETIVEDGIKLKTGVVIPLDVIIFGTGYSVFTKDPGSLNVQGSSGNTISEYFESKGGPQAYLGSCIPGFPNLFTLLGPNVASGHASVIFSQEAQISFAMQLIRPVLEGKARSFEVTAEATDKYNDWLQKRLSTSVWTDCVSYYQTGGDKSKVIATFPGPVALFWWFCLQPRWGDFCGRGSEIWERERKLKKWTMVTMVIGLVLGIHKLRNS